VANKIIIGKQCTVIWHMDDLKISRVDKNVVEGTFEKNLNKMFGKENSLQLHVESTEISQHEPGLYNKRQGKNINV